MSGRHFWIPAEVRALRRLYPHMRTDDVGRILGRTRTAISQMARILHLSKSAAYNAGRLSGRNVKGHAPHGTRSRFPKGHQPWNKGKKGLRIRGCEKGWFKKGNVSKRWDPELYTIGALRLNTDGYVDMKIKQGPRAWRALHVIIWEDAHGPVPAGFCLNFKDGDRLNIDLGNLELLSRAERMRRNTIHKVIPEPLKASIRMLGQLRRRIREKQDRRSA